MKHLSTLILMLAIGLHAVAVHAQNYRPFRFGITYQLSASTAADTTHLLRLASRQPQGSDSVFLFDKRVSRGRALPNTGACGSYTAHLHFGQEARTEVLKVLKTN